MPINLQACRKLLDEFKLGDVFVEHLGWDRHNSTLKTGVDGREYALSAVAHKRGFASFVCEPGPDGRIPDHATRGRIDTYVTKSAREHIIVYTNCDRSEQLWQWVRRAPGQPIARREYPYRRGQTSGMLIERVLPNIAFGLTEEDGLSIVDVTTRARAGFDVEKVTKRFYDRFKTEHEAFCKFLKGIPDESLQSWYVSVMLNRLMFIYFIQKKHFLDNDADYLKNRLGVVRKQGKDRYYREFLCPLFFEGFAKRPQERSPAARTLLGTVPYLNGGLFLKHQIEEQHGQCIQIPDAAFERLFDFFDAYRWHLDERPLRTNNEINPDVLGYIFEKYINQKQMGAYYTKEDITGYISQNTIIPFLFDAARKECNIAFKPDGAVWRLLRDDPDRYIYDAVRRGVIDDAGKVVSESALPDFVQSGMKDPKARMFDKRYNLGTAEIPGPDGTNLALPTETWREYVARRQRCLELREKLRRGEVREINDLITLNLDIRQFAEDVIATSEGPELVRAFWKAIAGSAGSSGVTVLDPTCGSGAFLFAALNILEPLYEACLNRMEGLLEDLARTSPLAKGGPRGVGKHHPEKFSDFRKVLDRIAAHPNHRYFVLKSIIINNLFGVDIMEEATEICKLRLFLKLVAQIERFDDIEPLPDIDFNVRAGNTLVGFATLDEVKKSMEGRFDFGKDIERIEEQARLADTAFRKFREMQTDQGVTPAELATGKEMVRSRMTALDAQLDRYLAAEYGVSTGTISDKKKYEDAFQTWRSSHEPFHWFVDFYGIMSAGGFDVIIGNPPYVEYAKVKRTYTIRSYTTESCGNLYAFTWERCIGLCGANGRVAMIVPVASVCTDGYEPLQTALHQSGTSIVSAFNDRPSKLFDGLEHIRLAIIVHARGQDRRTFSTTYNKWQSVERPHLFHGLTFIETTALNRGAAIAKIGSRTEQVILERFALERATLSDVEDAGKHSIYYTRKLSHFVQILDFVPEIRDAKGRPRPPSELKELLFSKPEQRNVFLAMLNSTLFYWLITVYSDCRNLNRREINLCRFDFARADPRVVKRLTSLAERLMDDIRANSQVLSMKYQKLGELQIQCTYPKFSKPLIDETDQALAEHFAFSPEQLDFLINFDFKYRMGGSDDHDDDDEA